MKKELEEIAKELKEENLLKVLTVARRLRKCQKEKQ